MTERAKDIEVLEGLEHVRRRPEMYLGDVGVDGLHRLAGEVIDNAVDEGIDGKATRVVITRLARGLRVEDDGSGIPVGVHPTHRKPVIELVYTSLAAGCADGCGQPAHHRRGGGLFGVGVSVVTALSRRLEVQTSRAGRRHRLRLARGEVTGPLEDLGPTRLRGTAVTFEPDPVIFGERVRYDLRRLEELARDGATVAPGLEVIVRDGPRGARPTVVRHSRGLVDRVDELARRPTLWVPLDRSRTVTAAADAVTRQPLMVRIVVQVDALAHTPRWLGFGNRTRIDAGDHVDALRAGLERAAGAVRGRWPRGLIAAVAVEAFELSLYSRADRLNATEAVAPIETLAHDLVEAWLAERPEEARAALGIRARRRRL